MNALTINILSGYASPKTIDVGFDATEVRIGRAANAEVRLDPQRDTACSRGLHAVLLKSDDCWELECRHASGVGIVGANERVLRRLKEGERTQVAGGVTVEIGDGGPRIRVSPADSTLPGTTQGKAGAAPLAHLPKDVVDAARRSGRRFKTLAGVSAALFIVVALVVWGVYRSGASNTAQAISQAATVKNQLDELESGARDRMQAVLAAASSSVWLVGVEDARGAFTPVGTAWTVAEGQLATNAHVAVALEEARSAGLRAVARGTSGEAGPLLLGDALVHPAYRSWARVFTDQLVARAGGFVEHMGFVVPGDVALLEVAQGDAGAPLPLAQSPSDAVSPGSVIGYAGFPMENVAGLPSQQSVVGRVSGMTDFFFQADQPDQMYLIHHNAVTVGGASGSPLLNAKGEVVGLVCAGSFVFTANRQRAPIGLNYAQRVDLVAELLDGSAQANQDHRDGEWRARFEELRSSLIPPRELVDRIIEQAAQGRSVEVVERMTMTIDGFGKEHAARQDLLLEAGSAYLIIAVAEDWADVDLKVTDRDVVISKDESLSWYATAAIEPSRKPRAALVAVSVAPSQDQSPKKIHFCVVLLGGSK
ncbi:MAG: trypsin-like peptidase domain-containing protein [Phycisphaerales bacterium]|nr:trypsin-like peptidase domain-containing protein [Phycisphaerales bacterium]